MSLSIEFKHFRTGFDIVFLLKPRCCACGSLYDCNISSLGTKVAHSFKVLGVDTSIAAGFAPFEHKITMYYVFIYHETKFESNVNF